MLAQLVFDLKKRLAHFHEWLGVRRPCDHAAVVVTQDDDGLVPQIKSENSLTRRVKAVAIDQGKDTFRLCHDCARCTSPHPKPGVPPPRADT